METGIAPNPFPPPPRRWLGPILLFLMLFTALCAGGYLVWELVRTDVTAVPPPAPMPDALAHSELATFERQLQVFQKSVGRLPTAAEGLDALVHRPDGLPPDTLWAKLRAEIPPDPWGRPYQYVEVPGEPRKYRVFSQGPDVASPDDDMAVTLAELPPAAPTFRTTQ